MMSRGKFVSAIALLLCAMAVAAITTQAQQGRNAESVTRWDF